MLGYVSAVAEWQTPYNITLVSDDDPSHVKGQAIDDDINTMFYQDISGPHYYVVCLNDSRSSEAVKWYGHNLFNLCCLTIYGSDTEAGSWTLVADGLTLNNGDKLWSNATFDAVNYNCFNMSGYGLTTGGCSSCPYSAAGQRTYEIDILTSGATTSTTVTTVTTTTTTLATNKNIFNNVRLNNVKVT